MNQKKKFRVAVLFPVVVVLLVCAVLTFVLLAGGARADEDVVVTAPANETAQVMETPPCKFDELVGLSSTDAAERLQPLNRPIRVLPPGGMATRDYSPARIDLNTDDKDIVQSVTCG